jgi:PAS domain-containing protein
MENYMIWIIDTSEENCGKILFTNQLTADILGIEFINVQGNNFKDYIPEPFSFGHDEIITNFTRFSKEASPDTAFKTFMIH